MAVDPHDEDFGRLIRHLQHDFNVFMLEGVRGVGKSTLCDKLLKSTNAEFYKTWGKDQRTNRFSMQDLGLDLPQGTYFVLDFLSQVKSEKPILADRCILSALAYQRDRFIMQPELHKYYVDLMRKSGACILYLQCDPATVYERRRHRKGDEMGHLSNIELHRACIDDYDLYCDALVVMRNAGLKEVGLYSISDEVSVSLLAPGSI